MDIELLRTFAAVAETRNFTRASERLNRVQSAVSMQVKRLEEMLQVRLFRRTRRRVELTPQGEVFLRYAHRILHLTDEALAEMGMGARSGQVRLIATDMTIGFLGPVLERYRSAHPLVEVRLGCMQSREALDALAAGECDLALVTQTGGRDDGRQIQETPLVWVSSRTVDLLSMTPLPLALFAPECIYRMAAIAALDSRGITYRLAYESPNRAGLECVVRAGLAITALPAQVLDSGLRDVSADLPALPPLRSYLFAREPQQPPAVRALADLLVETLGRALPGPAGLSDPGNGYGSG